mmetsp:Transcript_64839/g.153282  ORF Transcript_64839/g.153282 Transcript_64839/m.153282 type:complete len:139 (+) Transcript_64839:64-480(+)
MEAAQRAVVYLLVSYAGVKIITTLRRWRNDSATLSLPFAKPTRTPPNERFFPQYYQNHQGMWLYFRSWRLAPHVPVKGVVFGIQGMGDHASRFETWGRFLNAAGYHLYVMDHQSQGCSEGDRKFVTRFSASSMTTLVS